jgi:hypothetical protein
VSSSFGWAHRYTCGVEPLSLVTWLIDHLLGRRGSRPRLHLFVSASAGSAWFAFGNGPVHGSGPEVVIRAVVAGAAVEVEKVGVRLSDGAAEYFDSGSLPAVLTPPGHIEVSADRARLKAKVGNRRVGRLVAVDTAGRQFEGKVPKEWQTPETWPESPG